MMELVNSVLNLNDETINFETVFDPFEINGDNDTFGRKSLGGNRFQNLQTDLMNFNNQNNNTNNNTQPIKNRIS